MRHYKAKVLEVWCYGCRGWLPPKEFALGGSKAGYKHRCLRCGEAIPNTCKGCGGQLNPGKANLCPECIAEAKSSGAFFARIHCEAPKEKSCRKCGQVKPISEFGYSNKARDGHNGTCRECNGKTATAWLEHRRQTQPGLDAAKTRAASHVRRLKNLGRTSEISLETFAVLWDQQQGRCIYCSLPLNPFRDLTLEHLKPVGQGGDNSLENLALACKPCNYAKNDGDQDDVAFRRYLQDRLASLNPP